MSNKPTFKDINTDALWEGVEAIEQVEALVYEYLTQMYEESECDCDKESLKIVMDYIMENM